MPSDEWLFYGGLCVAGGSAILGMLFLFAFLIRKIRLDARLDAEYGMQEKRAGRRKKKNG